MRSLQGYAKEQLGVADTDSADTEIRYQIIFGCRDSKLRRSALQKDDLTLTDLVAKGRALEVSEHQNEALSKVRKRVTVE